MSEADTLSPAVPGRLEEGVRALLERTSERGWTLAVAESCTGGLLAGLLTDVPGVSHVFDRGFVAYSDKAKIEMLGVPATLIERNGAVSKRVAIAMAEGALTRSRAQLSCAITGFADAGDEPGLVHFACAAEGLITIHCEKHFGPGGRGVTRVAAMETAVTMMTGMLRPGPS